MSELETLLLIEDDHTVRYSLRKTLEEEFIILEASTCKRSLSILEQYRFCLILMDLNLPDGCGFELLENIRKKTSAPVIILSGEKNDNKKLKTFELGADDFLTKPYKPDLLVARIKAITRRNSRSSEDIKPENTEHNLKDLRFGVWKIDTYKFQLFDDNSNPAELSSREYTLLTYLIINADRAIHRQELCEAVKEENYKPTPRALDVKIARIRKKIKDDKTPPEIIKTVRGIGYMFDKKQIISN